MLQVISIVLNAFVIIALAVVIVYLIKKYNLMKLREEVIIVEDDSDKVEYVDEYGILHTLKRDKKTGLLKSYSKSNGEYYEFGNDEQGRLVHYLNHLGKGYKCKFNNEGQRVYFHDYETDKIETYTYDDEGRIATRTDINTEITYTYFYNENNEVYLEKDSEGRNTYILGKIPKDVEV